MISARLDSQMYLAENARGHRRRNPSDYSIIPNFTRPRDLTQKQEKLPICGLF